MSILKNYLRLASLAGIVCLPLAFAEPAHAGNQANVGYGHDYIFQIPHDKNEKSMSLFIGMFGTAEFDKINIDNPQKTDYTLQINTNWSKKYFNVPCPIRAMSGCQYREEFVYDTHYS